MPQRTDHAAMPSVASSLVARIVFKDARVRPVIRAVLYMAAAFASVAAVDSFSTAVFFGHANHSLSTTPASLLVERGSAALAIVALALFFRRYVDARPIASLGFSFRAPWLRLTLLGAALGAGMQAVILTLDRALGYARPPVAIHLQSFERAALFFIAFFCLSAIAEEMPIRGYVLQNLWEEWGFGPAVAVTAILFAAVHFGNPHVRVQFALTAAGLIAYGIWTALSLYWTKSLWVAFGSHAAWNFFEGPVFGFPVSGVSFGKVLLSQSVAGPSWFTGGAFGPEAGASGLIAMAAGFIALYGCYRAKVFAAAPDEREAYAKRR